MLETRSRATAYVSISVRSAEGARHFTDFNSSSGVPPDDYTHFHLSATMTSSTQSLDRSQQGIVAEGERRERLSIGEDPYKVINRPANEIPPWLHALIT